MSVTVNRGEKITVKTTLEFLSAGDSHEDGQYGGLSDA